MKTSGNFRYRGYDIVPWRRWAAWFVGIYPEQPDLPVLSRFVLGTLDARKDVAVAEAKRVIDRVLIDFDPLNSTEQALRKAQGLPSSLTRGGRPSTTPSLPPALPK